MGAVLIRGDWRENKEWGGEGEMKRIMAMVVVGVCVACAEVRRKTVGSWQWAVGSGCSVRSWQCAVGSGKV